MIALQIFLLLVVATSSVSGSCMSSSSLSYMRYISQYIDHLNYKSQLPSCKYSSKYRSAASYVRSYASNLKYRMEVLIGIHYNKNWYKYNGHCYTFVRYTATWSLAKGICNRMGSNLVTVDNKYENAWLQKYTGSTYFWNGLNSSNSAISLRWIHNSKKPSYSPFKSGTPKVCPRKCVFMYRGYWYVTSCTNNYYFICEKKC